MTAPPPPAGLSPFSATLWKRYVCQPLAPGHLLAIQKMLEARDKLHAIAPHLPRFAAEEARRTDDEIRDALSPLNPERN